MWLLRHGSAESEGFGGDAERALTAVGVAQARSIGVQLAAATDAPSLILCSAARRARETAALVVEHAGRAFERAALVVEAPLYLASAGTLLDRLARLDAGTTAVMVVGHNPGLSDLTSQLVCTGPLALRKRAAMGLSTGELIQVQSAGGWDELQRAGVEVCSFLSGG
jgi:phosphohistidine phosphatase